MSEKPHSTIKFKEKWFGPITPENAETVIKAQAGGWYALGVLDIVAYSIISWSQGVYSADLLDGVLLIIGGFFLSRRRSRALAGALFLYAVFVAVMTVLSKFNVVIDGQSGTNVFLGVVAVIIGWRGWRSTAIYQRKLGQGVAWKHVLWVSLAVFMIDLIVIFLVIIVFGLWFPQIVNDMVGQVLITVLSLSTATLLILLTHFYPFHKLVEQARTETSGHCFGDYAPISTNRPNVTHDRPIENQDSMVGAYTSDDEIYQMISDELDLGHVKKGLWTRIFAEVDGDSGKTKVNYIRERASALMEIRRSAISRLAEESEK